MKCLLLVALMGFVALSEATTDPIISPYQDFVTSTLKFGESECGCFPKAMTALTEITLKNIPSTKNPEIKVYGRIFTDAYRGRIRADFATVPFRQAKGSYSDYVILDVYTDAKAGVMNIEYKGQPGGKCQNLKFPPQKDYDRMMSNDRKRCFLREKTEKLDFISTKQQIVSSTFRFNPTPFLDMNVTYTDCCKVDTFSVGYGAPGRDGRMVGGFFTGEVVSLKIYDMIRRVKPFCTEQQQRVGPLMEHISIPRIIELFDTGVTGGEIVSTEMNLDHPSP
ncbi:uncharacterized protein LOC141908496 [Tubulanus polymorphus]|uniref:uncharacterized protein LOC141908496 n=1 Tax=Tubulanus polymorphus TaxID=672921 RepID=UPI003DA628CA